MMRSVGKVLLQAAQLLVLWASLWVMLALSPLTAQLSFAEAASKMCFPQANSCGCATCGCTPDFGRPSCPPGSSLYEDSCLPECPGGFIRYPGQPGLCTPPCQHGCPEGYDQVPLPQCAENYVRDLRDPNLCVPDYGRIRNFDTCAEGQSYNSQTGRCEFECLDGYYLDGQGQCRFAYDEPCRAGYTRDLRSGKCVPEGDWPESYEWICLPTCPQGTYRDIQHPTRCLPPPPDCDAGYVNENGRCLPICEQGTQRDRYGYCVPQTCPDGKYPNLRGQCVDPDCPYDDVRNAEGHCVPPDNACPDNQVRINGQCQTPCAEDEERNEIGRCVPVDRGCPEGQDEVNGQCVDPCKQGLRRDANGRCVPERQGCRQGTEAYRGKCVDICKKGTRRNADGRCVTVERQCPAGTFKAKNGSCIDIPTQPECKKGFRPDGNGGCISIITLLPKICPENSVYNKKTKKCERIRRARPQPRPDPVEDFDGDPDDPPPPRRSNSGIKLTPELLQRLVPPRRERPQVNQQTECPKGTVLDNNGRCVEG